MMLQRLTDFLMFWALMPIIRRFMGW